MKKIFLLSILFISLFFTNNAFAAVLRPHVTSAGITIDMQNKTISGEFSNEHIEGQDYTDIDLEIFSYDHGHGSYGHAIILGNDSIPWKKGPFSVNFGSVLDGLTIDSNKRKFIDDGFTPPWAYDTILFDVDDTNDSSIESNDHDGFLIIPPTSQGNNTQNTTSQNSVELLSNPTSKLETAPSGGHYYKVSFDVKPSDAFDLYLLLNKQDKSSGQSTVHVLCHKTGVQKDARYVLTFDPDPSTQNCEGQVSYNDSTFFTSGYEYSAYVSDQPNGPNIANQSSNYGDGRIVLDDIPASAQSGVVSVNSIEPMKDGSKNYYKFKGTINESKTGDLTFSVRKQGNTNNNWVVVKTIPYIQGNFEFPLGADIQDTPDLSNGHYNLSVTDDTGSVIYSQSIAADIGGNTNATTNYSTSSNFSGSFASSYNQGALVHTDCGYNLGKGGRMCVFTDIMELLNRVIDFIFALVLPIAAFVFVYVGFLYITSGANPEKRKTAKNAIIALLKGIVWVMLAWLIVKTILVTLGVGNGYHFLDMRT